MGLRPPRVRGLGGRWATEDSAGPRPAPRNFVAAATGSVFLRSQHQSLRGPSERGPRGGRPLPVVGGGPPRMRGLYRCTLCKRKIQQRARTDRPLGAGGAITNTAAGRIARLTVGFLSKNAPPGFRVRRVSCRAPKASPSTRDTFKDSYLVDPASSHML